MAISQVVETKTLTLIQETAADNISIRRQAIKNPLTGKIDIMFFVDVSYAAVMYEGTDINDRDEIVKTISNDRFTLTPAQVGAMFSTEVTLADGTETVLGELIANLTDSLILEDVTAKVKSRIRPWLTRNMTPPNPDGTPSTDIVVTMMGQKLAGVTYAWTVSDSDAVFTESETGIVLSTVVLPCTVSCEATETASGISEIGTLSIL